MVKRTKAQRSAAAKKGVLTRKRNVRINFPFFKQTSHYNVHGSEGNATTVGSFPRLKSVV